MLLHRMLALQKEFRFRLEASFLKRSAQVTEELLRRVLQPAGYRVSAGWCGESQNALAQPALRVGGYSALVALCEALEADLVLSTVHFIDAQIITDETPSTLTLETLRQLHQLLLRLLASRHPPNSNLSSPTNGNPNSNASSTVNSNASSTVNSNASITRTLLFSLPLLFDDFHAFLFRPVITTSSFADITEAKASQPQLPLLQLVDAALQVVQDVCRLCLAVEDVWTALAPLISASFTECYVLRKLVALTQPVAQCASILSFPFYEEQGLLLDKTTVVSFLSLFFRHRMYVGAHHHHL